MPEDLRGTAKFYCHKCSKQVENVIYSQDNSTNPPAQVWLCDKCFNTIPACKGNDLISEYEAKLKQRNR
ncbi:MAG: hypothetical protein A2287_00595 [Candidatus Melainabacteria bacterium RIFOXYA12_FULL_32_12]|nr:MAG: hypothetical protein A2287_00595 [Candidatus Melainabacteria bacterium RIFOXYA12_FULL_32_12]